MIPSPWHFALLALGAYRILRLLSYDTFPPVERARAWLLREWTEPQCPNCHAGRDDYERRPDGVYVGLEACPNCSSTLPASWDGGYGRPLLADLFQCPFCLGAWVALAVYLAWWASPAPTLAVCTVAALSGAVGLISKNLDA